MIKPSPYDKMEFLSFLAEYHPLESVRKYFNKFMIQSHKEKSKMDINQELVNNPALKEIVKEVVKEELKPEIEKMKTGNQHLQEGNMYLNE